MENKKIIFWNVDTQRDFMNPDGALYVEGAEDIKPNLKKLTNFAKDNNIMVVNTLDYHLPNDEELSNDPDFINTFPEHCMFDSVGCDFIDETNPKNYFYSFICYDDIQHSKIDIYDRNIIIAKNKFDVFEGNPHTDKFLDLINPDIVVVYGVATNCCVNFAVLGLKKRGISVYVVEDAIKGLPNLPLTEVYENWEEEGVALIKTKHIKDILYFINAEEE